MDDVLVIGAGPAGLMAAWVARQRGATVRVLASGIGTTHVSPGWVRILGIRDGGLARRGGDLHDALAAFIAAHPEHPYALAGLEALWGGLALLRQVGEAAGLRYVASAPLRSSLSGEEQKGAGFLLPTALGATVEAALVPESFAAGDLRQPGPMLIAGPAGWRDFFPGLCAENLARQGFAARGTSFDLPEMAALSRFDATPPGLARLLERTEVRARVAAQLRPQLDGATRVGLPAVIGLERSAEAWQDLQDRLGVPVFEIPTLPPSVPGMRLYHAFKLGLQRAGVPILLDMTATRGVPEDLGGMEGTSRPAQRAAGVVVPDVVRERTYRAGTIILATGGLYGGGIVSDHTGALRETVFGLPVVVPGGLGEWFDPQFLTSRGHPIQGAGVRANAAMQPVDAEGRVVLENVRIVGRLLAGYDPLIEGSTEGVWLATAFRAVQTA